MRSRYDLMEFSNQRDSKDRFYPDVMTLPTHKFKYTEPPVEHELTQADIKRFDIRMYKEYEITELDDIVRIVNKKPLIEDLLTGDIILFPTKTNLESFYNTNFV